jgi:DNA-binding NarL/FixJ family response regulator
MVLSPTYRLVYGEWLRRENRRLVARQQLGPSRARRELLATGQTVRKRAADSLRLLTPQEAQIAVLARDGLSNPEIGAQLFISPRTVEYHLRKVFGKLDISSRRELRQALPDVPRHSVGEHD